MKELFDRGYFEEHMRINHFRNHYEVRPIGSTRKWDELTRSFFPLVDKERSDGKEFEAFP